MFGVDDDGLVTFSKLYLFLKILISYHVSTIQTVWWTQELGFSYPPGSKFPMTAENVNLYVLSTP